MKFKSPIKILKPGYIYIVTVIFLGFAGINTGNNLIYLITSFLLGIMGISGFFGKRNIENLNISINLPNEIFANCETIIGIKIKNKKRFFPSFLIEVESEFFHKIFYIIPPKKEVTLVEKLKFKKRGIYNIEKVKIFSEFPFGFFKRFLFYNLNEKFIVFPQPLFFKFEIDDIFFNGEAKIKDLFGKGNSEFFAIKNYSPGDKLRDIYWKEYVKTENLRTKQYVSINETIVIDFDKIQANDLEKKLSLICYFVVKFGAMLKISNNILKDKNKILTFLATV